MISNRSLRAVFASICTYAALAARAPLAGAQTPYLHAPSVDSYAKHDPYGTTVLPDGRLLKPVGNCVPVSKWPTGVAVSPDGLKVFVSSDIIGQFIWNYTARSPAVIPFAPC